MKPCTASHFLQNETPSPEPGGPGPLPFDPRLPHSCSFTCSFHLHRLNLPYIIRFPTSVPLFVPPPSPTMLSSSHDFLSSTNLANIRVQLSRQPSLIPLLHKDLSLVRDVITFIQGAIHIILLKYLSSSILFFQVTFHVYMLHFCLLD